MDILQAPPPSVLPPGSVSLNEAAETQLKSISSTELSYQVCKVNLFHSMFIGASEHAIHITFSICLLKLLLEIFCNCINLNSSRMDI